MKFPVSAFLIIMSLPLAAAAQDRQLLADFENGPPQGMEALGSSAQVVEEPGAPAGKCLRIGLPKGEWVENSVTLPAPAGTDASRFRALSAWLKTTPAEGGFRLRITALDKTGCPLFQRRVDFDGGPVWHLVEWPLCLWRWDNSTAGNWAEVTAFSFSIETRPPVSVWIDEPALIGAPARPPARPAETSHLLDVAFPGGGYKVYEKGGFLLAADMPELKEEEVEALFARIAPIEPWLRRLFGPAVKPVGGGSPVVLMVFADREGFQAFFRRLGAAWRVSISAPAAGGYALQDFAASFYDPAQGLRRPVFVHEIVHAVAARNLRLLPGNPKHSWFQEALANYVQLALFPSSLPRGEYVKQFGAPPDPKGSTFFKPLSSLLTGRIGMPNYAQLASLMAFLCENRPEILPGLAQGLAEGVEIEKILERAGLDFPGLEKEWYEWGAAAFAPGAKPPEGPDSHFRMPEEWKKTGSGK